VFPQTGQATWKGAPQWEQNFAPSVDSVSHFGQRIPVSGSADRKGTWYFRLILTVFRKLWAAGLLAGLGARDMGYFAACSDSEGNMFGLIQEEPNVN
jgi:hypothetical protein